MLLWNILLAVAWAALRGEFSPANLLLGFGLGYAVISFARRAVGWTPYFKGSSKYIFKIHKAIGFAGFFLWELFLANLTVAMDVLTPGYRMRPGVIAVPLDAETDAEITLLANLITLTPGTLSLDVSTDRKVLYIHVMNAHNVEAFRREIKQGFERRVLELLR